MARAAIVTRALARRLRFPESEQLLMQRAAALHDIGKVAIPRELLHKRGTLTVEEFAIVKTHTTAGAAILSDGRSPVLRLAQRIALSHHEWWNGGGYPFGLRGEEIPIGGRIVALADVFDALTHDRPYKRALPHEYAVEEIGRLRAVQFDPAVVDAFLELDPCELSLSVASGHGPDPTGCSGSERARDGDRAPA